MTGRHVQSHRVDPGNRGRVLALATVAVLVVGGGWVVWLSMGDEPSSCAATVRLRVAAAPEIAPAISETADLWAPTARAPGGKCVDVEVSADAPADVAAAVATAKGVTVRGLAQANGSTRVPDVWIPDSSTWLVRLHAAKADLVAAEASAIARSPIVVAMPEPVARTLGWPAAKLTWADLIHAMSTNATLHVGVVDPTHDASGLSGLVALAAAASAGGTGAQEATVAALRTLVGGRTAAESELLAKFPHTADAAAIASGLSAAPLSERALIAYNAADPAVRLAAIYPEPTPPGLDYPYTVLPGLGSDTVALANGLRDVLEGAAYRDRLAAAGLRDADGSNRGTGFSTPSGAPGTASGPPLDATALSRALLTWISVTLPARMLAVIDVSGSMLTPVPTAGGATRSQVSVDAARRGMALFDESWSVGLWIFSTLLDGPNDYRQLVPIGPVSTGREKLLAALSTVRPKENGETGLYDTVLAAYKAVRAGWDPGAVNSVVILTDGFDRDSNGISLAALLVQLKAVADPTRPIQVIAIGIGDEVSEPVLRKIVATTGGGVFIARDPSAIGEIFLQAIALRPAVTGSTQP